MKLRLILIAATFAFFGQFAKAQPCAAYGYYSQSGVSVTFHDTSWSQNGHTSYWTFGDGASHTGDTITHTYGTNGTYSACLVIYDSVAKCTDTTCFTIIVTWPFPCNASIIYAQDSINPLKYEFYGSAVPPNGYATWIISDSGNLTYPTGRNISYTFSGTGTNWVAYILNDVEGFCDSIVELIYVDGPSNCTPTLSYTIDSMNPFKYYFAGSTPPTGGGAQWFISEGGSGTVYQGQTAVHTFSGSGTITVSYEVLRSDSSSCGYVIDTIIVANTSCQASYYLGVDTNNLFNLYIITNSTGVSANTSYSWSFGDGSTSNAPYPTHQYSTFGLYEICLTISDTAVGCSSTHCDSIGLDSNGMLLKKDGFGITVVNEKDLLSVEHVETIQSLSIYPNPSTGKYAIDLAMKSYERVLLRALNSLGQVILSEEYEVVAGSNKLEFDLTNESEGIYFINLVSGYQVKNVRVSLRK